MTESRIDAYGYNVRDELVSAAQNGNVEYAYSYDDIGNRLSSSELGTNRTYTANSLNQYTSITAQGESVFQPVFDLDGNQTLVKTSTGIWQVTYNGENRPVQWTCGTTNLTMKYDHMGRRVEYVECVGENIRKHQRFVYNGYLCIQRLDGANGNVVTDHFGWDPTEPIATRPLVWRHGSGSSTSTFVYTHDGNKNVSEVVSLSGTPVISAHYDYSPFGETASTQNDTVFLPASATLNPWRRLYISCLCRARSVRS